jgi:hypothetical protein
LLLHPSFTLQRAAMNGQNIFRHLSRVGRAELMRSGPLIPAAWTLPRQRLMELHAAARPEPTPVQGFMLIDTGAGGLTIDASVVRELGLEPTGRLEDAHGLVGLSKVPEYEASLLLPLTDARGNTEWKGFPVCAWQMPDSQMFQLEVGGRGRVVGILGRLLLQYATFVYDGMGGSFELRLDVGAYVARGKPGGQAKS